MLEGGLATYLFMRLDGIGQRRGNVHTASLGIYECLDGHLGVVFVAPRSWPSVVALMDAEWMLDDPRFATPLARLEHDAELRELVAGWAGTQPKRDVYERAGAVRAPVSYVHDIADVLASPQLSARDYFQSDDHSVAGALEYPGAPVRMPETPWRLGRAPLLGEHTEVVLQKMLGLDAAEVARLREDGVV
jgi:crotonobetainyl-CoA:carnitine CoA-transferase CaiB-like acyl-CoA transferase